MKIRTIYYNIIGNHHLVRNHHLDIVKSLTLNSGKRAVLRLCLLSTEDAYPGVCVCVLQSQAKQLPKWVVEFCYDPYNPKKDRSSIYHIFIAIQTEVSRTHVLQGKHFCLEQASICSFQWMAPSTSLPFNQTLQMRSL